MKHNDLVIGDTIYQLNKAYIDGANALRHGVSFRCNPYRDSSSQHHFDWESGHCNESAGEHFRFGEDVLVAKKNGRCFDEDVSTPRIDGYVDMEWYMSVIKAN